MNGKENIIARILSDADDKANYIVEQAEAKRKQTVDGEREQADKDKAALQTKLAASQNERVANALANAKLDARKYKLQGKQRLVSLCYDKALAALKAMDEAQTTDFVKKILATYAEQGEQVFVGSSQAKVVTQGLLDEIGKGLTLGGTTENDGILLVGEGYEKDLSYAKLVDYARDKTEAEVSAVLFGVKNV